MKGPVYGKVFNIQRFSLNDGPGIRTVVFLSGCPLCCRWCSNPESQNHNRERAERCDGESMSGKRYTPQGVLAEVEKDRCFYEESGGGMTLSGGEPLQQHAFCMEVLRQAGEAGFHRTLETTGHAPEDTFRQMLSQVDLLLFDLKHWQSERHIWGTGVGNELILKNLCAALQQGMPLVVRIPVIPGFNDSREDGANMASLLSRMGVQKVELLPFHQLGEKKYEQLEIPYAMKGVGQLHPEDLQGYEALFRAQGLCCRTD